jgi:dipeptidyl aminopeptidase/acylaminoacyl peptidase
MFSITRHEQRSSNRQAPSPKSKEPRALPDCRPRTYNTAAGIFLSEVFSMKLLVLAIVVLLILPAVAAAQNAQGAQTNRPMTIDDLFKLKRVSDSQISPDGKWVVYVVGTVNMEKNTIVQNLWLAATDGKTPPRQLTTTEKKDRHPRWRPDGKQILFESTRSGESQLYLIDLGGGEARQITTIATEASGGIWAPDGRHIAFVSAVYPEFSEKPFKESNEANKKRLEEIKNAPVKAKVFTRLFYRHWDSYVEDKRQHLFVLNIGARGVSEGGGDSSLTLRAQTESEPRDVTPGDRDAYPTSSTFETGDNFTFTPDSRHLVFTAVPKENEAWSTNYDLCRVSIDNKSTEWECLTKDNPAADSGPKFSPDGRFLAYRAQRRPGYEADRWEIVVVRAGGRGKPERIVTESGFDRSVESFLWLPGVPAFFVTAEEKAASPIFLLYPSEILPPGDRPFPKLKFEQWAEGATNSSLSFGGEATLAFVRASLQHPGEVFVTEKQGSPRNVSHANEELLAQLDLSRPESVEVQVDGAKMQMWILKPPGFDPSKKWPLVYLVHGGPQGAWEDGWSYRWNPQLWAAQGYVVALPNPRGSTGFGQKYVDEISGDWGGKCYEDLMKGIEYLEKQPYIDKDRMAAAGASFGGYMMNWFQGKTTKFKTLITHCSVYNHESMYATTDELWFDEWDHGHGKPLWENREAFRKHSPHLLAKNFKTPMLIIHNDLDFRCPVSEGHQLFTTLQRLGVPSKFINFPDEGHWVLKPKNSEFWHKEVFAWLTKYCPPGGK